MVNPVPEVVERYLCHQHVLTLSGMDHEGIWAASCFYVWHSLWGGFIVLSSEKTRHGAQLACYGQFAGTVCEQTKEIVHIQGIQYQGECVPLNDEQEKEARSLYYQHFPIARAKPSAIWFVRADLIKMTNNRLGFGHKLIWERSETCEK
ncbi:MAG: hypothetical protein CENE_03183 [Candidatus Celerinatantimonas neptuna]|nr:MAG: hypothetical protein CENE_03183 [Candidatus Celerinatantimonas neptuna]